MDVDKLEAGPETDALVAEHVMGWKRLSLRENKGFAIPEHQRQRWMIPVSGAVTFDMPSWSTDWAAAGEVMGQLKFNWNLCRDMGRCGDDYETRGDELYRFVYSAPGMPMQGVSATTAPLAICRAALKAVED